MTQFIQLYWLPTGVWSFQLIHLSGQTVYRSSCLHAMSGEWHHIADRHPIKHCRVLNLCLCYACQPKNLATGCLTRTTPARKESLGGMSPSSSSAFSAMLWDSEISGGFRIFVSEMEEVISFYSWFTEILVQMFTDYVWNYCSAWPTVDHRLWAYVLL